LLDSTAVFVGRKVPHTKKGSRGSANQKRLKGECRKKRLKGEWRVQTKELPATKFILP
jgi:hypothetical protein